MAVLQHGRLLEAIAGAFTAATVFTAAAVASAASAAGAAGGGDVLAPMKCTHVPLRMLCWAQQLLKPCKLLLQE
jgi:hypothetical protein